MISLGGAAAFAMPSITCASLESVIDFAARGNTPPPREIRRRS